MLVGTCIEKLYWFLTTGKDDVRKSQQFTRDQSHQFFGSMCAGDCPVIVVRMMDNKRVSAGVIP